MKKLILFLTIMVIVGCRKTPFIPELPKPVDNSLKIENSVGIKLQSPFVTSEVAMNVKVETSQTVNIKYIPQHCLYRHIELDYMIEMVFN